MAKRVYCTYFDHNYLSRGLALFHSLLRHEPGLRLWVLCLSDVCYRALVTLDLPNLVPRWLAGPGECPGFNQYWVNAERNARKDVLR